MQKCQKLNFVGSGPKIQIMQEGELEVPSEIIFEGGYSIIVRQTQKNGFLDPPMMSFAFLDMIFGGKGLQIDTYKPPKCIWSYHTHVVNTS